MATRSRFSLLNIVFGLAPMNVRMPASLANWASWTAPGGQAMAFGILGEAWLGLPPYFVVAGGVSILAAAALPAEGASRPGTAQGAS